MDAQLRGLCAERRALLKRLARVLGRVGERAAGDRSTINHERAAQRWTLNRQLRVNAEQLAARCLELDDEGGGR